MTTIAYRDGILAGDRQATAGELSSYRFRKVHKRKDGALIGGCGVNSLLHRYTTWFLNGEQGFKPHMGSNPDDDIDVLIVRPDGTVEFHDRFGGYKIEGKFFAIGSGAEYALGAMQFGASARQAISCAAKHDRNTGGGCNFVALPGSRG